MANHQQQQQQQYQKKMDHFSHKHPLTLIEIEEEKSKSEYRSLLRCYGCTEKIEAGVPYYRCEEDCPFFCLHHACAHLPTTITRWHALNGCDGDLRLMELPLENHQSCFVCSKLCYSFAYVCSVCTKAIDIRCTTRRPNEAKHSFHQHPVQLCVTPEVDDLRCSDCSHIIRRITEEHDVCFYYRCNYCNFTIHPECTDVSLWFESPSHPHTFFLVFDYRGSKICKICQEEIDRTTQWAYECRNCEGDYYIHAPNDDCLTSTIRKGDLQHFDHDHPLALVEQEEEKAAPRPPLGDDRPIAQEDCHCCRQKISSSIPYYTCIHCNKYRLHQLCANLPIEIEHPLHPDCPLKLLTGLNVICDLCTRIIDGFTYHCSPCHYDLDVQCVMRTQTMVKIFHNHPLFLSLTKGPFSCHACDRDTEGSAYHCTSCKFWVHDQCACLPTLKDRSSHEHEHDLELIYTIPKKYSRVFVYCRICTEPLKRDIWAYHCNQCRYLTHINDCSDPRREGDGFTINPSEVVHLPLAGEPILEKKVANGKMIKYHRHPMILFADQFESNAIDITQFLKKLIRGSAIWPTFHVDGKYYSEPTFSFDKAILTMQITNVDLPRFVKHESHPHVLKSTFLNSSTWCHACEQFFFGRGFKCTTCAFTIDTYCTLLPRIIKHRYDEHGFSLTYSAIEGVEEYVCEICEEDVNPRYFYHCERCDQSIHARCIWQAYVRFEPHYVIHRVRLRGALVPHTEKFLPQCIICDQKQIFGNGFSFAGWKNGNRFMVHLTCLSEDDVGT